MHITSVIYIQNNRVKTIELFSPIGFKRADERFMILAKEMAKKYRITIGEHDLRCYLMDGHFTQGNEGVSITLSHC